MIGAGLATVLQLQAGDTLTVELREGRRPVIEIPVAAVAETLIGSPVCMAPGSLNGALREPHRISGAHLRIDRNSSAAVYRSIKDMPAVAGISLKDRMRAAFRKMLDAGAGAIRYVMTAIAGVITFGIVCNSARIAFAERSRDLASLRVIGFTAGEAAFVLLGELAVVTLMALPLGSALGYALFLVMSEGFSTDLYQIPAILQAESLGLGGAAVLAAAAVSG